MKLLIFAIVLFSLILSSCSDTERTEYKQQVLAKAKNIFAVLPEKMPGSENDTPDRIALGKKLYMDGRLSENDKRPSKNVERHIIWVTRNKLTLYQGR